VVIQEAMQRALAAGGGLSSALQSVRAIRERGCQVPIVLFGYYNPIFVYGNERFAAAAADAGVDAVLTVDLPIDELDELRLPLADKGIDVVPLIAPTSTEDRLARLGSIGAPFVYYISMTGVTGSNMARATVGSERVDQVRAASGSPVAVGFGIKTPDDARRVAAYADGVVVGSAVVRRVEEAADGAAAAEAVADLVASLRGALEG
jgi:tryptophan synthase alpha chain